MSSLESVMCCQVEVSGADRLLVQRNSIESGVSEFDRETSIRRRLGPLWVVT